MSPCKICLLAGLACGAAQAATPTNDVPRTIFQASCRWMPEIDVRSDGVMAYGATNWKDLSFAERMRGWREHGYRTLFMTGVAWGHGDYLSGRWDGIRHEESESQTDRGGKRIMHSPHTPYILPTDAFARYLCEKQVKPAIDAGAEAIFLEEPECWSNAGWCEAFRRSWKDHYGTEWTPPDTSATTAWQAGKLKQRLFRKAIESVLSFAKDYARQNGREVGCYVATHSTINYAKWKCVSPEASLALVPCVDGYIAQVWSDTAISPVVWRGESQAQPFEVAYLEYGSAKAMVAPTGRRVWFLTDPAADGRRGWADFRKRYEATYAAQLLHADVDRFQVLPWPNRIYMGTYKVPGKDKEERIPSTYATQMQVMINALNDMPKADCAAEIGLAISDTLMLQRASVGGRHSDACMSDYFGLALPLVKRGVPLSSVYLENAAHPKTFAGLKVLCLSYEAMKPPTREANDRIADWVKAGGRLVWCGSENDPYRAVPEWWNAPPLDYATPSQHLFERLGLGREPVAGVYTCGKGGVTVLRCAPAAFLAKEADDGASWHAAVASAFHAATGRALPVRNALEVRRGPYLVVGVMEQAPVAENWTKHGRLIDLFDPTLPILSSKTVKPGAQAVLYDLDRLPPGHAARVLCGASRITDEQRTEGGYSFCAKGPKGTVNASRILLPAAPQSVVIDGRSVDAHDAVWDAASKTLLLRFVNSDVGKRVTIKYE